MIDLHLHTTMSDGTDSPDELVIKAKRKGLSVISITDHETVAGLAVAKKAGKKYGVTVIDGVEISAQYKGFEVHILGFNVNHKDKSLLELLVERRKSKKRRAKKMISNLKKCGVDISYSELMQLSDETINRSHIADLMVRKGYSKDFDDAFNNFLVKDKPGFHKGEYLRLRDVVKAIKNAGGIAVIAHPCIYGDLSYGDIEDMVVKYGFDGIEVFYPLATSLQIKKYKFIAKKYSLVMTGGSDYHGKKKKISLGAVDIPKKYESELLRVFLNQV